MNSRFHVPFFIVTVFWAYVALCDVLGANSTQTVLTALHFSQVFAPSRAQLLQHLFLYPVLVGCVWVSTRLGWQPFARRIPLQALLGIGFSALAIPCLVLGDIAAGDYAAAPQVSVRSLAQAAAIEAPIWLSSVMKFLLNYAFAIALVTGFELYRTLRDEETHSAALERAFATARLASLRMQLSPHSLFNLLHTIQGQIEWDPGAARALVVRLGELLRRLLNASEREFWRLGEEVRFARLYLELQQKRFADRLEVVAPDPAGLSAVWVPTLILQPLVENAVVHGLCGHRAAVTITVQASASNEELMLRVVNTTSGEARPRNSGIGLNNVRDRLAIHFEERASLRAAAGDAGHWVAEIRLPLLFDVGAPAARAGGSDAQRDAG